MILNWASESNPVVARRESGSAPVVLSACLRVYRSDVLFSSYSSCLADEWSFLSDPDPPYVCVALMEGPVEVGQGEDVETDEGSDVCAAALLLWVSFTPACSTWASLSF